MAALVVTALVASHVYLLLGGPLAIQTLVRGGFETPAMAAAMSYFVLNTLLVAMGSRSSRADNHSARSGTITSSGAR